ncbi:MAG: nucleotide exchange factor GrpE [FCB group bacterium]|nr:nucleotide exchange factor GrpE [FCB group bacterium]
MSHKKEHDIKSKTHIHNKKEKKDEEQKAQDEMADTQEEVKEKSQEEKQDGLTEEEKLKQRIAELEDKLLRTAAEFENYKKRVARQYEEVIHTANDKILLELLEVVDNFERALQHSNNGSDAKAFRQGMELIFNQMADLLKKYDITPIEAMGKPFDPELHEALMHIPSDEHEDGVVTMEISKGYRKGDRVLRHSKVGVSNGQKKEEA